MASSSSSGVSSPESSDCNTAPVTSISFEVRLDRRLRYTWGIRRVNIFMKLGRCFTINACRGTDASEPDYVVLPEFVNVMI